MSINAIAVVVGGLAAFLAIATLVFDLRRRKHKGVSGEEFIRAFSHTGTPEDIPDAVYKFYTRSRFFRNLTIAPDDSLKDLLNEGEADIEDDAMLLMKKLGLSPPAEEVRLRWNEQTRASRGTSLAPPRFSMDSSQSSPIQTVRDMVLWLDWVRQHQERDA